MKVPQARSRISIAPSMLVEKKGKGYKDVSIGQAPREDTIDYPPKKGMGMSLPIKISVAQKRTLKKGGAITIKPNMIMKEAEHELALLPASAKKIMNSIVKNKGIRHTLKQGEDLVNRMTGKGLISGGSPFTDFFTKTIPRVAKSVAPKLIAPVKKIGSILGKPYEVPLIDGVNLNPFDLGYALGHDVIGPELERTLKGRRKKRGGGKFEDFFTKTIPKAVTKTIPRAVMGKVNEYKSRPQNSIADVLDTVSPIKIPIINRDPISMLIKGKGGKLVSVRNGCGTSYLSKPNNTLQGGSFVAAGGGLYPAGKYGGMVGSGIDTPIQLGSPYIKPNSPAMTPFIPTRGIQSSQII